MKCCCLTRLPFTYVTGTGNMHGINNRYNLTKLANIATSMCCMKENYSVHKSQRFLHNLFYILMVVYMHFWYGASGKGTFMLYSDKFGFMLLPCLVIDLKSVIKLKSHDTPKRHVPFLTGHYTIVLIAGPIFCIAFWTLADHVHACTFVRTHVWSTGKKYVATRDSYTFSLEVEDIGKFR